MRCLIGVSISPMVGSIYNMGVWDKGAAAWVNTATRRTLREEVAARVRYKETGRSLANGGCIGDPHIVVNRCLVFLCILHCRMAMGCLQVAFIEARPEALPKDTTEAVQWILYRTRTGVKLGSAAAPDGEESRVLFLAWEELGPLLPTPRRMVSGKPWLPFGTSSGNSTLASPPRQTFVRRRLRAHTPPIVARPGANPTTSFTWRRMSPRLWPMRRGWGWYWARCVPMSLRASTPSSSAPPTTTPQGGGEGFRVPRPCNARPRGYCKHGSGGS